MEEFWNCPAVFVTDFLQFPQRVLFNTNDNKYFKEVKIATKKFSWHFSIELQVLEGLSLSLSVCRKQALTLAYGMSNFTLYVHETNFWKFTLLWVVTSKLASSPFFVSGLSNMAKDQSKPVGKVFDYTGYN